MSPLWLLAEYSYSPFFKAAPLWGYWYLLLLPLCLAIAIVYKSIRCDSMSRVPKQALELFAFIIVVMVLAAGALAALVNILD
jgi:prolipoprotein diacylglyceryltransferase